MAGRRLPVLTLILAALVAAGPAMAASPFDPFKQLWKDPRGTMKRVIENEPGKAPPPAAAEPAAPAEEEAAAAPPPSAEPKAARTADVPLPRPRPTTLALGRPAPPKPAPEEAAAAAPLALVPPEKPRDATPFPDATRPLRKTEPRLASLPPAGETPVEGCARRLAAYGIDAVPLGPIHEGACGVKAPAAVASLDNGAIAFTEKAIVNCEVAGALAAWMSDEVEPAAKRLLGGRITAVRIAASYDCRGRNRVAGAQLSEHAFGNAIDISGFKVDGLGWIEVGTTRSGAPAAFLATIRKAACGPFTTVLGPGVAYHDEHLHLDLAKRRKGGPSKGLYCK